MTTLRQLHPVPALDPAASTAVEADPEAIVDAPILRFEAWPKTEPCCCGGASSADPHRSPCRRKAALESPLETDPASSTHTAAELHDPRLTPDPAQQHQFRAMPWRNTARWQPGLPVRSVALDPCDRRAALQASATATLELPAWREGAVYALGQIVQHRGQRFRCVHPHRASMDAASSPDAEGVQEALWQAL